MSIEFRLRARARVLFGYGSAVFCVGALAGCMHPEAWNGHKNANVPSAPTEQYQLADGDAVDAFAGGGSAAYTAEGEGAEAPSSLESRIQEYVDHFAGERSAGPDGTTDPPRQRLVANRQVDVSSGPPAEGPAVRRNASFVGRESPVTAEGRVPQSDQADITADASAPPPALARPAREQAPPTLLSVGVEADLLQQESRAKMPEAAGPGEPNRGAKVAVTTSPNDIQVLIEGLEKKVAQDPNDLESQIRLRLLYIASGEDRKASVAPPGLAEETAGLVKALAETIIQTRDASADLSLGGERALETARSLTQELGRFAQLNIPRVVLARRVDSFGVYTAFDPPNFVAGSPICAVVYTELENFYSRPGDEGAYETRLSQRMELLDEDGQRVWEREDQDIRDVSKNRRADFFLAPVIRVPGELSPGSYTLRVEVEDCLSGKFTSATVPLNVVGAGRDQRLSAQQAPGRLR